MNISTQDLMLKFSLDTPGETVSRGGVGDQEINP